MGSSDLGAAARRKGGDRETLCCASASKCTRKADTSLFTGQGETKASGQRSVCLCAITVHFPGLGLGGESPGGARPRCRGWSAAVVGGGSAVWNQLREDDASSSTVQK